MRLSLLAPLLAACSPTVVANVLTPGLGTLRRPGLAYGDGARRRLDLYLPAAMARDAPLLVFFYGGAWQDGERGRYAFLGRALAARGAAVAVPDYRLWPQARWPGFLEDAAAAIAWLRGPGGRQAGAPQGRLLLMGHSAGGFIAASLALDRRWLGAAGPEVAGGITLAAPFDWAPREAPLTAIFAAAPDGAIRAAPGPLQAPPPMLLLHGAEDRVVHPRQSEAMAARLREAGHAVRLRVFPGMGHIGIMAALAAPVRALGLAGAPVMEEVADVLQGA